MNPWRICWGDLAGEPDRSPHDSGLVRVTGNYGHSNSAGVSITRTRTFAQSVAVNVAPVGDSRDDHDAFGIVHCIDDAVIADADPEVTSTSELCRAGGSRVDREPIDRRCNPIGDSSTKPLVGLDRLRVEADVVSLARRYLRTFDQGTAGSSSSRACSAARLSSKYSARSTRARYCSTSMRTAASRPRLDTKRTSSLERSRSSSWPS